MKPAKITAQNIKLTRYFRKRTSFPLKHLPVYTHGYRENAFATDKWFECCLGSIDDRKVWLIFQMDVNSEFYMDIPLSDRTEDRQDSHLRAACSAFMLHVVTRAAREIPIESETTQTGFRFVQYDVDRTYSVMQTDFASFAKRCFSLRIQISVMCGLQFVRFYVSSHGMRLSKKRAEILLHDIVNVDHAHLDVLQVHRAI